jgi:hypothetical protein
VIVNGYVRCYTFRNHVYLGNRPIKYDYNIPYRYNAISILRVPTVRDSVTSESLRCGQGHFYAGYIVKVVYMLGKEFN